MTEYVNSMLYNTPITQRRHQMKIMSKTTQAFDEEIGIIAQKSLNGRLQKAGIDPKSLENLEYQELLETEISVLKSDTKKVGSGIVIGIALSLLTGF